MIVTDIKSSTVETNTGYSPTRFKIKSSARAFQVLSGFYSDPIQAIPRELGANAWDAHVKAGTTNLQFEVHVPNNLEPWFSIRDFGTGLSPKDIDVIYTTYFESTKTGDNESDGCMGLGSKTPFNYTENFTVTSWFNGMKYTYDCFVDSDGGPSIVQLATDPSNEHNGLQIKFAVKSEDIPNFINKIRTAYLPFHHRPKLVGIHDIKFPEIEHSHSGTGWAIRKATSTYRQLVSYASMGNYSYPISEIVYGWTSCKGISNDELSIARKLLSNGVFDFHFEIGDLDVAPNKEQLQYDSTDRTRAAIIRKAVIAKRELEEMMINTFKPKTRWEGMKMYHSYNSDILFDEIHRIVGHIKIKFENESIENYVAYVPDIHNRAVEVIKDDTISEYIIENVNYNTIKSRFKSTNRNHYFASSTQRTIILYSDQVSMKKARIKKYLTETYPNELSYDFMFIVDTSIDFSVMWKHQEYLGIPKENYIRIESLPNPKIIRHNSNTLPTIDKNQILGIATSDISEGYSVKFRRCEYNANTNDVQYYIPLWNGESYIGEFTESKLLDLYVCNRLLSKAIDLNLIPKSVKIIFGINKSIKKILKDGTWINVFDILSESIKKTEISRLEKLLAAEQYRVSLDIIARDAGVILSKLRIINKINNKSTCDVFNFITKKLYGHGSEISTTDRVVISTFSIFAKSQSTEEYTLEFIDNLLKNKYMGIFSMISLHSLNNETTLPSLINFIDETSKI